MRKSDSIKAIAAALHLFHVKMGKVKKDANNPFFKSKYASLSNILDSIADPLTDSGLSVVQFPDGDGLTTLLMHTESGEWMEATYTMPVGKPNDPQAVGSAITYARRYALGAVLQLNIDEDDDANAAVPDKSAPSQSAPKTEYPEDNRPWMTQQQFDAVVKRISEGDVLAGDKAKQAFRMKKEYRAQIEKAMQTEPEHTYPSDFPNT